MNNKPERPVYKRQARTASPPEEGTKNVNTPPVTHRVVKHSTAPQKLQRRWPILVALALVVVLLVTVLMLSLSACGGGATAQSSAPYQGAYSAVSAVFREEEFVGTVLPQTEDAGIEYAEETLFLGDSNTQRMLAYYDITGVTVQNGIGVVGMGIQSVTGLECVSFRGDNNTYTMPQAVGMLKPQRVVITFGSNNVGMNIDTFIDYYKDALDAIKEEYEYADIIIGSIFPVDMYRQNTAITMERINAMNVALAELARQEDVKFLNWGEALLDEQTGYSQFEYTIQDGVHLTRAAMEVLFDYFRTHSYITEDDRPTPLGTIPQIAGVQPTLVTADPYKIPGPIDWSESTSASQSEAAQQVSVSFSSYDETLDTAGGGSISGGGQAGTAFTLQMQAGGSVTVVATPAAGYEFAGWSYSVAAGQSASGNTLTFTVPQEVVADMSISVVANFRAVQSSSSLSQSQSGSLSASGSSQPASSSAPPVSSSVAPPASSSEAASSAPPASSSVEPPASSSVAAPESSAQAPASSA